VKERPAEYQLILDCGRFSPAEERHVRINRTIERGIDWELFLRTAHGHGMVPLLHLRLSEAGVAPVPPKVIEWLRGSFQETTWRNTLLAGELTRIVDVLASHGIDPVPFKGPVLAALAYENVAMRQFGDIDLLVQPHEHTRTRELLFADGYTMYDGWSHIHELNYEYTLVGARGVRLDVHWQLFPRAVFPIEQDELRQRLTNVQVGDKTVRTFSPEDTLLIVCVHGDMHAWDRLMWVCDIAQLVVSHPGLDWTTLVKVAESAGSERLLLLGLRLADDLLGVPAPEPIMSRARADRQVTRLSKMISEQLFESAPTDLEADRAKSLLQLLSRERLWHKLWLAATPNESDWEVMRLPKSLSSLYYVIRPFRLLGKYGRRLRR
jgi:hypothetical protein